MKGIKKMCWSKHDIVSSIIFGGILLGITAGTIALMPCRDEDIQAYATEEVPEYHTTTVNYIGYEVPDGKTSFKSYMSYKAITNTNSAQYKLQQECWTDSYGLRRYDDKYVIALGSFYTDTIGDEFKITLDTGKTFRAVVGDFKSDRHTDELHQYTPTSDVGKCVIEFVVDMPQLDETVRKMGDVSYCNNFDGNVEKIEKAYD
jgi:hypothetical protein